jgi:DNA-directed RNA polymerase II subunit RPB1
MECQSEMQATLQKASRPMNIFLRQLENTMLNSVSLRGVKDIKRVFLLEHDNVTINDEGTIEATKEKVCVLVVKAVVVRAVVMEGSIQDVR